MEGLNLIALAIPVFFLLIGIELLVAHHRGEKLYRLNDSLNDLSCGIVHQVLGVFTKAIVFGAYVALYGSGRLFELSGTSAAVWLGCFLGVDFFYYWFHRISHESNLPWGAHIVHHQSEEFNLAVALRQGALQPLFGWIFYLPLAVVGVPPLVFLTCNSLNTLYQFWIHTRMIGKLGPFEWIFNTPSHHRVHHGFDDKYLDKNYAGTLIIWDRLFGTFQEEEEEPTYGITKPLKSWNPLWANVHHYRDLALRGRRAPNLREKVHLWLAPPAYQPEWSRDLGRPEPPTPLSHGAAGKYDARAPAGLGSYALAHFAGAVLLTSALLFFGTEWPVATRAGLALAIGWTVTNLGGIFERSRWVLPSELSRLAVLWIWGIVWSGASGGGVQQATVVLAGTILAAVSAGWMLRVRASAAEAATH